MDGILKMRLLISFLLILPLSAIAQKKILFDNTHSETASNADWQIDADIFNLHGNEANPQRFPSPVQSNIIASTPENYWTGALSSWGIALVKLGYSVETLPANGSITFGSSSNPQDLSHYDVFVVDEPNNPFTAAEKTALLAFVQSGGGLFMISDHNQSDRDNDGWDSPMVWNNFLTSGITGFQFDQVNLSGTFNKPNALPNDSVLAGPQGNITQIKYSNGTTLHTTGTNVIPLLYSSAGLVGSSSNIVALRGFWGNGRFFACGDSSPMDDGTGDPNDQLYPGWTDLNGQHSKLMLNATIWLAEKNTTTTRVNDLSAPKIRLWMQGNIVWIAPFDETTTEYSVRIWDLNGSMILSSAFQTTTPFEVHSKGAIIVEVSERITGSTSRTFMYSGN